MKRKIILGAKYFIKDLVLDDIFEVQIIRLDEGYDLTYKNLKTNEEYYRDWNRIEIVDIINEVNAQKLNNEEVFSINTNLVKGILGREEIIKYSKNNFKDLNINEKTVLISITDPDKDFLPNHILSQFKDSLSIQFWDMEETIGILKPINTDQAKIIKKFILDNKENNFVIHCEAGISRSAGVGLSVFYIIEHNEDRYGFQTSPNPIKNHHRYHPNWKVFDMIAEI